jgi:hypothetical protein
MISNSIFNSKSGWSRLAIPLPCQFAASRVPSNSPVISMYCACDAVRSGPDMPVLRQKLPGGRSASGDCRPTRTPRCLVSDKFGVFYFPKAK